MKKALGGRIPEAKTVVFPVWRDDREFLYSKNDIVGAFAMWSVRQSPYNCPADLYSAIQQLYKALDKNIVFDSNNLGYAMLSCDKILDTLEKLFDEISTIEAWNQPEPDDDFIDLGALARNIAHTLTLESLMTQEVEDEIVLQGRL